ncbi:MAG: hypothetical protein QF662_07070, partial [Phycisphaerae bacterium]|nr:hypothetical protein [Phycisphaerae bacterium]
MRTCVLGAVGLFALALHAPAVLADFKDDIGYTALVDRGEILPDGSGMAVIQVEVESGTGTYMPTLTDPEFVGKTITPRSGASGAFTHAKIVGWYFYGLTTSMTPGISTIDVYEASGYMGSDSLKTGENNSAPSDLSAFDVMNHSWIGTWGGSDTEILRRFDWQIANSGIVATVAVNNVTTETGPWTGQDMPRLLSSSYNAIAVGVSSLYNSNGPTPIDIPGRAKPDLVAPGGYTSWASPMVGSSSAILLAQAGNQGWAAAEDPRTIKSILMAGTEK